MYNAWAVFFGYGCVPDNNLIGSCIGAALGGVAGGGNDISATKYISGYVRAVRGGPSNIGSLDNLILNGNGTVTDSATGLMWQQATTENPMNWQEALYYCENLALAGYTDWRLPTIKELIAIVDYSRYNPAIDTYYFYNIISSNYWSGSTDADHIDYAWGGQLQRRLLAQRQQ